MAPSEVDCMRVRFFSTLVLVCLCVWSLKAQQAKQLFKITEGGEEHVCASDLLHQRMLQEDEAYRQRHEAQQEQIQRQVERFSSEEKSVVVHTIPVVVHIFHTGEPIGGGSNISDAQVQSAIVGLNEDYRKQAGTNGDGNGVDVEVQFCLASRDPDGNPTDGIIRVDASSIPNYATEGISIGQGSGANENTLKALSKWDRNQYYNIWIVNEIDDNDGGAGVQGFAYFPTSSAAKDGAVILYNAFGTVGALKSYTSLNRTVTHELGHAFYLYHTFQGNSCSETNCSSQGDYVCDTPPTTTNTSCNSPACSGNQQVENYMDYTSETCMDMFTQGQKDRMRSAIMTSRSSLLTSLGCTPPNALDAGIASISSPSGYMCSATTSPIVELKNFGSSSLTSVQIKYRVDGGPIQTYSYTGNIASGESVSVTLPSMTYSAGTHSLEVYTESPNGGTDGFQSNDSFTSQFEIVNGNIATVTIDVDNYGNETTWTITDGSGDVVASGGPYPSNAYGTSFETDVCLDLACYDFTIYDSYGDGICCGNGFGAYNVSDADGNILASSGVDFNDSETTEICLSASTNPPIAEFNASSTSVCQGGSVQFNDLSAGGPTSWSWSFSGGSPSSSTSQSPTVSYNSPGTKTVSLTVTNANGTDTETKTAYVTVGADLTINGAVSDAQCWNSSDGGVNISLTGGTAPFSYNWNIGASSQDISGLDEGSYTVTVQDGAGCSATQTFQVDAPNNINASNTSVTDASCSNDGTASVCPTGGTPGYSYLWNDPAQQTTSMATGLSAGPYMVVITDSNGCQKNKNLTVNGTGDMDLTNGTKSNVTCYGESNGSATVDPVGGSGGYTYLWNDVSAQTTATASGLSAGVYSVSVTDDSGCQSSRSFNIHEPNELAVNTIEINSVSCAGMEDGEISVEIVGGTEPYSFNWNGAGLGQTLNPDGVAGGDYSLNVTDDQDCSTTEVLIVPTPNVISAQLLSVIPDSCNLNVGRAEIEVSGGTGDKSVHWDDDSFQTGEVLSNVRFGNYQALISDENNCEGGIQVDIGEADCVGTTGLDEFDELSFVTFPNPIDNGSFSIQVVQDNSDDLELSIIDITGKTITRRNLQAGATTHQILLEDNIAEGIYLLQLSNSRKAITERIMVIR